MTNYEWLMNRLIEPFDPDTCVEWPFGLSMGYGSVWSPEEGGTVFAHRIACEFAHGPRPGGAWCLHDRAGAPCASRACINPHHLRWGTPAGNSRDMVTHGNSARGRLNGNSVLTETAVHDIRHRLAAGETLSEIGGRHKVSMTTVSNIKTGAQWGWLDTPGWKPAGGNVSRGRLAASDIQPILDRLAAGDLKKDVAADYGVRPSTISNVASGKTWSRVSLGRVISDTSGRPLVTDADVHEIRNRLAAELPKDIAADMGISSRIVTDIRSGHTWSHLETPGWTPDKGTNRARSVPRQVVPKILEQLAAGIRPADVAVEFGISVRTAYRMRDLLD